MGSPEFAVPSLQGLSASPLFRVVGVVTQPDRPAGRGRSMTPPAVKIVALELGYPITQPKSLKETQAIEQLNTWKPDVIVVAAYGQILRATVLELPRMGCINVHASLLPRWRGAAPIQAAIEHGDKETGVTIMCMDPGLDTGPIISQRTTPIGPQENAEELSKRLAELGAELLLETLPGYIRGEIEPIPQVEGGVTYAPMLKKGAGELDFNQPAQSLERKVRAFNPWPGAYTSWKGQPFKVHRAHAIEAKPGPPGKRTTHENAPAIHTPEGLLVLDEVQPAGKKAMSGEAFLRGAQDWKE